jgi:hypothetical protein
MSIDRPRMIRSAHPPWWNRPPPVEWWEAADLLKSVVAKRNWGGVECARCEMAAVTMSPPLHQQATESLKEWAAADVHMLLG